MATLPTLKSYVAEVLAARELLCVGLERLQIGFVPSSANFVLIRAGTRALEIRDYLRERGILVRDRSLRSAWLRSHHRGHARADALPALGIGGSMARQLIVFDMDGVLVDVTESYRETIVRTVEHFTGRTISRR